MAKIVIEGLTYRQFGHDILFTQLKFKELNALVSIDPHVQRELDTQRRNEIKTFILRMVEQGEPLYFAPFIFSARGAIHEQNDQFYLDSAHKIFISDGQHRIKALDLAIMTLCITRDNIPYTDANKSRIEALDRQISYLENYLIPMQIYLQLDKKLERQMFSDINSERREAHPGQLLQFDRRDTYSVLTRQLAEQLQDDMEIELKASRLINTSSALTTLVIMKRCLIALFEGTITTLSGEPHIAKLDEETQQIGLAFFKQWLLIFPKKPHDRQKYVSGLSGIQIALARTVYELVYKHHYSYYEAIAALSYLKACTWQHTDPLFQSMYKQQQNKLTGHSTSTAIKKIAMSFVNMIEQEMAVKK